MFGNPLDNSNVALSDIGSISSGGTPSRRNTDYYKGDINWYSAGELNSLYLDGSIEKITKEALDESPTKLYPKNTLLIGMYDTAAMKMGILREASAANQACAGFIPSDNVNILWLYNALTCIKSDILSMRRGCRQRNLNVGMIKNIRIHLPEKEKQNQFVTLFKQSDKSKCIVQTILTFAMYNTY